jgi:hypothetical protein
MSAPAVPLSATITGTKREFAMRTEQIKDSHFNVIAYLDTEDSGSQKLRDSRFNVLGYDPQRNVTTDKSFNTVGYGNLLLTLLCRK